jgi:hypothetical protein
MSNTNNTIKSAPGIIAKAAAQTLKDNLKFVSNIEAADESDFDGKNGYKAGDTIYTSVPARYIPQTTFDITSTIQDSTEEKRALPLDISSTVGIQASTTEFATEIDLKNYINRFVIPAAESIAQDVERRMLQKATQSVYNLVGTAGSTSFTIADVQSGKVKLDQAMAPMADRNFLLNSTGNAAAVDARKGLFQDANGVSNQYKNGLVGRADGFDWMSNELIYTHTNGNDVTGATMNATSSEADSTVALAGITATTGTVLKGTVFTIASVFKVHPITKVNTGVLQQFVVTADATANGSAVATVSISPSLYTATSKGLQNINALPQSGAAIVFSGAASTAYAQNLQFHKSAFKMASVPLVMPTAVEFAAQETVDGVTIAVVRAWDQLQRKMVTRLDFLGGLCAVRPEWATRVTA